MAECVKAVQNYANNLIGQGDAAGTDVESRHPGLVTADELKAAKDNVAVLTGQYSDTFAALKNNCDNNIAGFVFDKSDWFSDYGMVLSQNKYEKRAGRAETAIPQQVESFMSGIKNLPQDDTTGIVKLNQLIDQTASIRSSGAR